MEEVNNTIHTSKRCVAMIRGNSPIKLFARVLLGYPHWNSPARELKWLQTPVFTERITIKRSHLTTTLDKNTIILNTTERKSKHCVYRLLAYEGGEGEDKENAYMLPTPLASDGERGGQLVKGKRKRRPSGLTFSSALQDLAKSGLLPTPICMDAKGNVTKDRGYFNLTDYIAKVYSPTDTQLVGGTNMLNPLYVEEMMGFPKCWTLLPYLPKEEEEKKRKED